MNIIDIIDAQRWDCGCIGHKQHNSSLDRIEAVATMNERMLDRFREVNAEKDKRIADLEAECTRLREKLIIKAT